MRDYALETTFDIKFTTRRFTTGAPFTLAGSPVISAYPGNSTTQLTAGITLTVDFDGVTGLNNIRVVATAANGYAANTNYALVITTGTVDSVSVVGEVVGEFSLEAQSPLRPTVAARTLDVSAGGEAGVDWANVGSPTTTVGLSGTTVKTATDVETDTADIQSRLPAALVSGRIDASVGAMAANVLTAAAINADAITDAKVAADVTIAAVTGAVGSVTGNVGGNVVGSVASVTAGVTLAASAVQAIWDAATAALTTAGSIGKRIVDFLTGDAYTVVNSGTHGNAALKTLIDAKASQASVDDLPTNAELATALAAADDAVLAAIAALNNLAAGAAMTLTAGERNSIATALLDLANGVEASVTLRQAQRLQLAALVGKLSGAATTTVTIRNTADDKDRVVATVDANGNRSAVTLDAS